MRRFVLGWKQCGHEKRLKARVVVYADDFVILCRGTATRAKEQMQKIMTALKLTVNEKKTRIARVPEESFDFLGYTIGRCYSMRTGRAFIGTRPSRKSTRSHLRRDRRDDAESVVSETGRVVGEINRKLQGWGNYFCLGAVSRAYRAVDNHARHRLRQWLNGKHRSPGCPTPFVIRRPTCTRELGCSSLSAARAISRGRQHELPCPKAGCGKTARPV